jgi:hypothetical protein
MLRRPGRSHDTRRARERRPHHGSVGAQHAAPAEELSGSQPQEAPEASPGSAVKVKFTFTHSKPPHA